MSHLKDVKIAIMGWVVNDPGKVSLHVDKECVERNIPSEHAEGRLIQLIKDHGKWVDVI